MAVGLSLPFLVGPPSPWIDLEELAELARCYGAPVHRMATVVADAYLWRYRGHPRPDRRGEVVFAVRQPNGGILLHTKRRYETPIYRLPTGGIRLDERVQDALFREVTEELGQPVEGCRFLGLLDCRFTYRGAAATYPSYIFYLESPTDRVHSPDPDEIGCFRTVSPQELAQVAASLRALGGKRAAWGRWRALPHDLVHQLLTGRYPDPQNPR